MTLALPTVALAQLRTFDVPSGPATKSIPEFAAQAGVQIIAPGNNLRDIRTPALNGDHDVHDALKALLKGTGLKVVSDGGGTIVLAAAERPRASLVNYAVQQDPAQSPTKSAAPAPSAEAAPALQEVVITAERRTAGLQRTAAAVTVKSGDDLLAEGRYTLRNILEGVPGVTGGEALTSGTAVGSGTDNPASGLVFRGIPSNLGTGGSITSTASAAAIYVDEIYNGVGGGYDIEQVEVLRGPQGTLYGRSATSGVVAIRTKNPNASEFSGDIALETGSGNLRRATGGVNIPIINDKLALRVSGNYYDREGYRISPGGDRTNAAWRAKLLFTPTENLSVLLGYTQLDNDSKSSEAGFSQIAPDKWSFNPGTDPSATSPGENKSTQYWAQVKWDLS